MASSKGEDVDADVEVQGLFKIVARYVPYFRNPQHVLVFKLDCLLLTWTFIAGILKEMDQSATAQAYVSGMKESLQLYGNELVNFNTFFSVGYAIGLIPGQLIQTKVSGNGVSTYSIINLGFQVRASFFLPFCEISWGILVTW